MYLTIIQNLYLTKQDRTKIKLCKVCRGPNTDHYILTFSHISETRVEEGIGETEGEREREREREKERERDYNGSDFQPDQCKCHSDPLGQTDWQSLILSQSEEFAWGAVQYNSSNAYPSAVSLAVFIWLYRPAVSLAAFIWRHPELLFYLAAVQTCGILSCFFFFFFIWLYRPAAS